MNPFIEEAERLLRLARKDRLACKLLLPVEDQTMKIERVMRLRSELEVRSALMSSALLLAFAVALAIQGTAAEGLLRFIDPLALALTKIDALRDEIGRAIGGAGPDRWLTITFTADPAQL